MTATATTTTPGLKRLRTSPNAEAIRTLTLADAKTARKEAAAKIAAAKAEKPVSPPAPSRRREDSLLAGSKAAQAVDLALRPEGASDEEIGKILSRPVQLRYYAWDAGCSIERRDGRVYLKRVGRLALRDSDPRVAAYYAKYGHVMPST